MRRPPSASYFRRPCGIVIPGPFGLAAEAAVSAPTAAAAQQDDDENDTQAAAVVPVVPHVLFHLTYQSETYYEGGRADAAWPRKIFRPAHRAKPHRKKGLNP